MEVLNKTQMPSTPKRSRGDSFCHHDNNPLCTPSSGASQDTTCSANTNGFDMDNEDTSDKESDGEEDDSEKEAAYAPSVESHQLRQAGLTLMTEEKSTGIAAVANMGLSTEQQSLGDAVAAQEDEEEDDDMYDAVDDIPDEYDEDMNDPLDVSRLFSQEELPSDPINDMPMRSIELDDELENNLPKGLQGDTFGRSAYNFDFQAQRDLDLLSPTSMSKADFSLSFPDMSGYEAGSDNETVADEYSTMMTSNFPGSIDPAETLKSTSPKKDARRKEKLARKKNPRPPKMGTFVIPSYKAIAIPYSDSKEFEVRPAKRLPTDADIEQIVSNRRIVHVTACIRPPVAEPEPELPKTTIPFPAEDQFTVFSDPTIGNGTNEAMVHAVDLDSDIPGAYDYPLYVPAEVDINLFKTFAANSDQESEDSDCDSNFSTFFDLDADLGDSRKRKASSVMPLAGVNAPHAKRVRV